MQKILFAVLLALVMTLALVGVKRTVTAHSQGKQTTVLAIGSMPAPPIPW